jgi:predicted 2-oxoglutarate/Fe(II)-dependent dioxygenase YbiX
MDPKTLARPPGGAPAGRPAPPPFGLGDRLPNFRFPDATGAPRDFQAEVTGRPAVLLLAQRLGEGQGAAALAALNEAAPRLAALGAEAFIVAGEPPAALARIALPKDLACLAVHDPDQRMIQILSAGLGTRFILLDANQRALAAPNEPDPRAQLAAIENRLAAWSGRNVPRGPAPVLLVPDVLPHELCDRLIALWESDNREGKVSAGSTDNFYSPDRKKNREHVVQDPELSRLVATYVTRRIGPELAKAFAWDRPYRLESFIVLGYSDERQDFFGRHRDRYLPEHPRRFAMSLNLNDGYEGGELRFPEYSDTLYVPPKGGACLFSCSLLHEALPVTRGRRFTMTTFFLTAEPPAAPGPGPAQR